MDRLVHDHFLDQDSTDAEARDLTFLLDEGLGLLANFAKVKDRGVRQALAGLVEAIAKAD